MVNWEGFEGSGCGLFEALNWHLPGGDNHNNTQPGQTTSRPRFEQSTAWIQMQTNLLLPKVYVYVPCDHGIAHNGVVDRALAGIRQGVVLGPTIFHRKQNTGILHNSTEPLTDSLEQSQQRKTDMRSETYNVWCHSFERDFLRISLKMRKCTFLYLIPVIFVQFGHISREHYRHIFHFLALYT
jgi:hypothetical protein